MTTFLILTGCALLAAGGAIYFSHAARHDPRWIAGSLFFPPVVPLYYRRHWEDLRVAGLVQGAGLVMAVAGLLIHLFQSVSPDGVVEGDREAFSSVLATQQSGFVDSERALRLLATADSQRVLIGRVNGSEYRPDRAELIDGMLRLSRGDGFFPDLEIAVYLGDEVDALEDRYRRSVAPDTPDAPPVYLSWRDPGGAPVTQIINGGYRMEVELAPSRKDEVSGYLRIMLPDGRESYAVGEFKALTSHLRYRGDEVDRRYDHEDTLFFIAEEFLASQYPDAGIESVAFEQTEFDSLAGSGRTLATVTMADGRSARHIVLLARGDYGWTVQVPESIAATNEAGFESAYRVLPPVEKPVANAPAPRQPPRPAAAAERVMAFGDLGSLAGRGAVVEFRSGRREEGVLRGLRRDRLVVETIKSGGVIEFSLAAEELAAIRLNNGEVIRFAGAAAPSAGTATASAATTPAAAPQGPIMVAGVDVGPLVNRNVRVVSADGKSTTGILRGVNSRKRLVVETQVGGGKVEQGVPLDQVVSVEPAGR